MTDPDKVVSPRSTSSIKILPPSENSKRITWWDRYKKASIYAKIFLFVSTIHGIAMAGVGTISIAWPDVPNVYGTLSVFVALCFLYFMLQGVLKENAVQLLCCIISAVLVTVYLVWFYQIDSSHPIIASLAFGSTCFCVLYVIIAPCVIKKFGWYRYNKSQTTNKHTMDMYYVYQKFQAMLLMDAEVCIMLGLLVTFELRHQSILGYIGNIACILFEIAWVALGIRAVRTEHKLITQGFMGCTVFLIAYVVVICYWIATDKQYSEQTSELQFFVLGSLALIVRALVMIGTWMTLKNFDKGLRQYFDQGAHYIDFWGQSNQQLLAGTAGNADASAGGEIFNQSTRSDIENGGMSSRSRINSDDFD